MRRLFKQGLTALALSLASTGAWAQGAVVQVGPVTPGETAVFVANGMLAGVNPSGGGGTGTGPITPSQITVSNSGLGICQNSTGGSPSLCSGFINGVPAISTPSSSLIMSIGGVQYALPASFNSGGGSGPVPGAPVVTTSLTVNNANLGATWANGLGTTLSEGFVGGIPTISTPSTSLNISIGGTTYALPAAFGGGGGGGGSGGCASCLPLSGGTLTGLLIASAGVKLPDNQLLTMSTDGTRTLSWQASSNTFTFQNAPVQFNAGAQLTDGQSFIFNATEGTAIALYDTTLNRVRFENVPVQIDNSLYIPGGNVIASGTVAAGDGLLVTGAYSGYTNPGLNFSTSTFASGAPAIILGDNNAISFSTAATGFQLASSTTSPQKWQLTWNGAPIFSVDSNGNLTCAGTGCSSSAAQTFSNVTVTGNQTISGTLGVGGASTFTGAVTLPSLNTSNASLPLNIGGVAYALPAMWNTILASGAKCDGVTDDTAAISAYFSTLTAGSYVTVPAGKQCLINSGNLVVPENVIVAGLSGALGSTTIQQLSYSSGFIINPTYTIVTNLGSQLRDLFIQPTGLISNPTSGQVITAVAAWGASSSVGVTVPAQQSRGVILRDLFIIGFNTAIKAFGGDFNIQNVSFDCYNGLDISGAGDNTYIDDMRGEPFYALSTTSTSGSWARPGIAFNLHDNNTGTFLTRDFSYMYASGLVFANTGVSVVSNSGFEWNDANGNGITQTTGIRWIFHNAETSIHLGYATGFANAASVESTGEIIMDTPTLANNTDGGTGIYLGGQSATPATVTIAGTPAVGNTVTLTITSSAITGSPLTLPAYTVVGGDTATTIAAALAQIVNASPPLIGARFFGNDITGVLSIYWPGSVTATVTKAVTGGVTATIGTGTANSGSYGSIIGLDAAAGNTPYITAGDSTGISGRWTISAPFFTNVVTLPSNWLSLPSSSESPQLVLSGIPWSKNPTVTTNGCGATAQGFSNGTDASGVIAVGTTAGPTSITACAVVFVTQFPWTPKGITVTTDAPGVTVYPSAFSSTGFTVTASGDLTSKHIFYTVIP